MALTYAEWLQKKKKKEENFWFLDMFGLRRLSN